MSLTTELKTQLENSLKSATPGFPALIDRVLQELRDHEMGKGAPKVGELAADFTLPNVKGGSLRFHERLKQGPVILAFYRGGWCPYCNIQLRAYQRELVRIQALGAAIIAVSPQTPDASLDTAAKNALAFDVLSDVDSHTAQRYGLTFKMPDYLIETYKARNILLPNYNGNEDWMLPIPATFVVSREGRVVLSHVDVDYRTRLDPEDVVAALQTLTSA